MIERVVLVVEFPARDGETVLRALDTVRLALAAVGIGDAAASLHLDAAADRIAAARDGHG